MKKVWKTWDWEKGRMITARKVVTPPLRIAGPRLTCTHTYTRAMVRQGQTYESCPGSLSPTALHHREGVGEVDTVVDTQSGGQHDVDTRDHVCSSKHFSIELDTTQVITETFHCFSHILGCQHITQPSVLDMIYTVVCVPMVTSQ